MLYRYEDKGLVPCPYYDYYEMEGSEGREKDLENLLAKHLQVLFTEDSLLMPIFQERPMQPEPDLFALDRWGNLVIFELKLRVVVNEAALQIMRYAQTYGTKGYFDLDRMYQQYKESMGDASKKNLKEAHAEAFELPEGFMLTEESFNQHQKLVIVGNSSDTSLIKVVNYWKGKGLDIDFLPYRFYKIQDEIYFEFFAKPYDYHIRPQSCKGVMFDTNLSYSDINEREMLKRSNIEAYGQVKWAVDSFNKDDYALFYSKGRGIIAIGRVTSKQARDLTPEEAPDAYDGRYHKVEMIVPKDVTSSDFKSLSAAEIKNLLGQNFYFARTDKRPYLSTEQVEILINELKRKYGDE